MTLDVDVVALGGRLTESGAVVTAVHAALAAREASSPMLTDLGLVSPVRVVPADAPFGSLGAGLGFTARSAAP